MVTVRVLAAMVIADIGGALMRRPGWSWWIEAGTLAVFATATAALVLAAGWNADGPVVRAAIRAAGVLWLAFAVVWLVTGDHVTNRTGTALVFTTVALLHLTQAAEPEPAP